MNLYIYIYIQITHQPPVLLDHGLKLNDEQTFSARASGLAFIIVSSHFLLGKSQCHGFAWLLAPLAGSC